MSRRAGWRVWCLAGLIPLSSSPASTTASTPSGAGLLAPPCHRRQLPAAIWAMANVAQGGAACGLLPDPRCESRPSRLPTAVFLPARHHRAAIFGSTCATSSPSWPVCSAGPAAAPCVVAAKVGMTAVGDRHPGHGHRPAEASSTTSSVMVIAFGATALPPTCSSTRWVMKEKPSPEPGCPVPAGRTAQTARPHRPRLYPGSPGALLNDPNGFIRRRALPSFSTSGTRSVASTAAQRLGHVTSTDLLHWQHRPVALLPTEGL